MRQTGVVETRGTMAVFDNVEPLACILPRVLELRGIGPRPKLAGRSAPDRQGRGRSSDPVGGELSTSFKKVPAGCA